ncbi:hypothetical protein BT63DRAFT_449921 [Microthyrium microscopicum]|uniref:Uncharacterized protein n=1 Tax=Microthyrium microscopicum TaxID=703497 RepID=A0A6A6UU27_9PEZI|nr:hypothetical protein BT63DRAFT_449921 [Microthyrium microscopicum]
MGRTSKFSFPLPGRKARSDQVLDGQSPIDEPKLSKVERLLGTSNLPSNYHQQHHAHQPRQELRKPASSISLSLYESTIADSSELDYDIPEVPKFAALSLSQDDLFKPPPRSLSAKQMPSSRRIVEEKRGHPRSQSSSAVPSMNTFNHYSPSPVQPSMLDRPSFSAMRQVNVYKPTSNANHSLFPVVEDTSLSAGPGPVSSHSSAKDNQTKKRPTKLDLSKLFPRPTAPSSLYTASKQVTSPPATVSSFGNHRFPSDVRPQVSPMQSPSVYSSRSQKRLAKKPNVSTPLTADVLVRPKTAGAVEQPRRQHKSRKSKNWFDGLLEAEDSMDVGFEPEVPDLPESFMHKQQSFVQKQEFAPKTPIASTVRLVELSSPYPQPPATNSTPQDTRQNRTSWQGHYAKSFRASVYDVPAKRTSVASPQLPKLIELKSQTPKSAQPKQEVILDEPELEDNPNLPDIRDSLALSDFEDDDFEVVTIGEAQAFHVPTQTTIDTVETVQVHRTPKTSQSQISLAFVDEQLDSVNSMSMIDSFPTSPANRMDPTYPAYESLILDNVATEAYPTGRPEMAVAKATNVQAAIYPKSDPRQRFMEVTEEEEALLEMMRLKRAAMASHSFAEGYKTALLASPGSSIFTTVPREMSGSNRESLRSRSSGFSNYEPRQLTGHDMVNYPGPVRSPYGEQRRGSESLLESSPDLPNGRLRSASTAQSTTFGMTSYRDSTIQYSQAIPAEPMFIRLSAISTSPAMVNTGLSTSPSEKSGMSGLPSPVTPQATPVPDNMNFKINANSRSNSNTSIPELIKDVNQETPKSFSSRHGVHHRQHNSDSSLYTHHESNDGDVAAPTMTSLHEHNVANGSYTSRPIFAPKRLDYEQSGRLHPSAHAEHNHVHYPGCCGAADVRCSVAEDVMAAWGSLGGWQELDRYGVH